MTSVGLLSSGYEASTSGTTDRLPDEMNRMSIRDEKVKIWSGEIT
jgi:glycogen synthase kinase 3 beta